MVRLRISVGRCTLLQKNPFQCAYPGAARGVSLSEMVTALAIAGILAGALVPLALQQMDRARKARTLEEIGVLAKSLMTFREDLKVYPDRASGSSGQLEYLLTEGVAPAGLGGWPGDSDSALRHLVENAPEGAAYPDSGLRAWRGPYLPEVPADPWGRAYILGVAGMRGDAGVYGWLLSAGPNGVLETGPADAEIASSSDDLGWRLR